MAHGKISADCMNRFLLKENQHLKNIQNSLTHTSHRQFSEPMVDEAEHLQHAAAGTNCHAAAENINKSG